MATLIRRLVPGILTFCASAWFPLMAQSPELCEVLEQVLEAAEARDGFAAVTGADAGNYVETSAELPGATFCKVTPDRWPAAVWDCLLADQGKYTLALQVQGKWKKRIADCLGERWSASRPEDDDVLASTIFSREGSVTRIRLLTTREVTARNGWRPHRVVLLVYSPRPELDPAAVGF